MFVLVYIISYTLISVGISCIIIVILDIINKNKCNPYVLLQGLMFIILGIITIWFSSKDEPTKEITPLDVYRGNTELQVNYKIVGNDTIITDSIVIWTTQNYIKNI